MKKMLLTLGTVGAMASPIATVVACNENDLVVNWDSAYDSETKVLSLTDLVIPHQPDNAMPYTDENNYDDFLNIITPYLSKPEYGDAEKILLEGKYEGGEDFLLKVNIDIMGYNPIDDGKKVVENTTLDDVLATQWGDVDPSWADWTQEEIAVDKILKEVAPFVFVSGTVGFISHLQKETIDSLEGLAFLNKWLRDERLKNVETIWIEGEYLGEYYANSIAINLIDPTGSFNDDGNGNLTPFVTLDDVVNAWVPDDGTNGYPMAKRVFESTNLSDPVN